MRRIALITQLVVAAAVLAASSGPASAQGWENDAEVRWQTPVTLHKKEAGILQVGVKSGAVDGKTQTVWCGRIVFDDTHPPTRLSSRRVEEQRQMRWNCGEPEKDGVGGTLVMSVVTSTKTVRTRTSPADLAACPRLAAAAAPAAGTHCGDGVVVELYEGDGQYWPIERIGGWWDTYGSLVEAEGGDLWAIEYPAFRRAERRLEKAAPKLAKRIEFDQSSDGTGISAKRRSDLVRALDILGLPRTPPKQQRLA